MIVVTNTIQIKKGHGRQVAARFKNPKGVHTMPGFVKMELLLSESGEEAEELKVVTTWQNKASFDNWVNSDSFKEAHARRSSAGTGGGHPGGKPPEHAGSHLSSPSQGQGGHHSAEQPQDQSGHPGGTAAGPGPIMLGSKLSIHELLFTQEAVSPT
ncbi:antibiotic biosynthesis monooxygenase [Paenibacillus beijingensis]|uniref:ABM domain-containing protein n=1 Tax=Paenibacillus beijingensis TaxID=1126833 RepID=A0A0D5NJZ5_9BACL|nr:antibiotic biosynthesis monooxygenase [Paenibacillus beijingensis]AJY75243.1 hypothetical protein VN24_12485 [Paenibacillus beijingensis]